MLQDATYWPKQRYAGGGLPLEHPIDSMQFLNGAGGSPKDRVALSIINTVYAYVPSLTRY